MMLFPLKSSLQGKVAPPVPSEIHVLVQAPPHRSNGTIPALKVPGVFVAVSATLSM